MPFCSNCGVNVNESSRFCHQCGTPRAAAAGAAQPPPPPLAYTPQAVAPQYGYAQTQAASFNVPSNVSAILPNAKMMTPQGAADTYTLVFTSSQTIFAKLTGVILKNATDLAQAQARAAGKGWLGRMNDQMRAPGKVHEHYLTMTPAQILAETPGNFAIDHAYVACASVREGYEPTNADGPGDPYVQIEFATNGGILKFRLRSTVKEVMQTLNNFYPGRITR